MRAREFLNEKGLIPSQLGKHSGKYIEILLQLTGDDGTNPVEVSPEQRTKYGETVRLATQTINALKNAKNSGEPLPPAPFFLIPDPQTGELKDTKGSWGALHKSAKFTQLSGKTAYNKGHLNELFMGLAVSLKFINKKSQVTVEQVKQLLVSLSSGINFKNSSTVFEFSQQIQYHNKSQPDSLSFFGLVPSKSAEALIKYSNNLPSDLLNLLSGVVLYVNESKSVDQAITRVMSDPNTNLVEIKSDGTSESKSTKADLILSIDNQRVNLISLKTSRSNTLGQYSGLKFEALQKFFSIGLDIDITPYRGLFLSSLSKKNVTKNIFDLYDGVIFPKVFKEVTDQSSKEESKLVRQLSNAANIFARGEKLEDVEVVKISDNISTGSYKILRFSDNLYDAMKSLDLSAKLIKSPNGRTIQILAYNENDKTKTDKLCQFRSQLQGGYLRNNFEIGPIMEKLTQL